MSLPAKREAQCGRHRDEAELVAIFANPRASLFDLLMAEFALQPENAADPGVMRSAYLKQLYVDEKDRKRLFGARVKADVPQQLGVKHLHRTAELLRMNETLRDQASFAITTRKIIYAEFLSGMPPFGAVTATADEELMSFMTRIRPDLQPIHWAAPPMLKVWDKIVCCFPGEVAGEPGRGEACTCVHLSTAARACVACMYCKKLHRIRVVCMHAGELEPAPRCSCPARWRREHQVHPGAASRDAGPMRARLVQYAMDNQLYFNTARLQSCTNYS